MIQLLKPYETFAKNIFGVFNCEQIARLAEAHNLDFNEARDAVWSDHIDDRAREHFRQTAAQFSGWGKPGEVNNVELPAVQEIIDRARSADRMKRLADALPGGPLYRKDN